MLGIERERPLKTHSARCVLVGFEEGLSNFLDNKKTNLLVFSFSWPDIASEGPHPVNIGGTNLDPLIFFIEV